MMEPRSEIGGLNAPNPDLWLEYVELKSDDALREILSDKHPADIADLIKNVPFDFQMQIINLIDNESAAEVLSELDEDDLTRILPNLSDGYLADLSDFLPSDDITDILNLIDTDRAQEILTKLTERQQRHVNELMQYDEESAGGLMVKERFSVSESQTVNDVIEQIRRTELGNEEIYNVYITDSDGCLKGSVTLFDLIKSNPAAVLRNIMETDLIEVKVETDQEEVAELFRKYDLAAAPVVDASGRFIGRITHDDALEAYAEEFEEDMALLSGQTEIDPSERSWLRNIRQRLPWLVLGLIGGVIAAVVISQFETRISEVAAIVFFLPLVAAMGGNAGIQTSSVMVRGLATGEIQSWDLGRRLFREFLVAVTIGTVCGGLIYAVSYLWRGEVDFALVVGLSLMFVIVFAALVGAIIPLILRKLNTDPALATGPFITTLNDIVGLFIYLALATWILVK